MPRKRRLEDMVTELYASEEVQRGIIAHATELGTRDKIESGELSLPSEEDAIRHVSGMAFHEENERRANNPSLQFHGYDPDKHLESKIRYRKLKGGD